MTSSSRYPSKHGGGGCSSAEGQGTKVRFCFCRREETLAEADRRLAALKPQYLTTAPK
jgi:hypothetical protein